MPDQTSITLAPSLVVTIDIAPGIDTTGIDIDGAKSQYDKLIRLSDAAVGDPGKDWSSAFRKLSIDPALTVLLDDLVTLVDSGVHIIGHSHYTVTVTRAKADAVELAACVDTRGQDIVDESGQSVRAGSGSRHPQQVTLQRVGRSWFVSNIDGQPRKSC